MRPCCSSMARQAPARSRKDLRTLPSTMVTEVRARSVCWLLTHTGSTVAKHAGQSVHNRVKAKEPYKSKEYEKALKQAFLATDDDLRSSASPASRSPHARRSRVCSGSVGLHSCRVSDR